MIKYLVSILLLTMFSTGWSLSAKSYLLEMRVLDASGRPFISHREDKPFGSYLIMDIDYLPIQRLFEQVRNREKNLITRGEAHITVVTPPEFDQILKPAGVTMNEVEQIAQVSKIQQTPFEVVCLGMGKAKLDGTEQSTYYVVVRAPGLVRIREKIQKIFIKRGGNPADFKPEHFWPHITVGFTKRDLYESDGVLKDIKTCVSKIKLVN